MCSSDLDGQEQDIVGVNSAAIPAFISVLVGKAPDDGLRDVTPAPLSSVTLDVLNGTDTALVAAANADRLEQLGFHVYNVDSAALTTTTVIEYPANAQAAAKAVSLAVPKARLVPTTSVSRVTLILGTDGVRVPGAAMPGSKTTSTTSTRSSATAVTPSTSTAGCIN